jgi:glycosyltransferase involved in cell wall biosynthesis
MSGPATLRVAMIAGEDPGWGGIGTYTGEIARGLAEAGHDVQLLLRGWEEDGVETLDGLTVHRITVPEPTWRRGTVRATTQAYAARESLLFAARAAGRVEQLRRSAGLDLVEAPEFGAAGLLAALRSRLRGAVRRPAPAVVVRLHAPGFLTAQLADEPASVDARLSEALERAGVRSASLVSSPSRAIASVVAARWGMPRCPLAIVPNPIDARRFTPAGVEPDAATLLVVGRIERNKGQDLVVEALPRIRRAVPTARLLLVGADSELAGGGSALAALRARAAVLGLPDDAVQATGAVPRTTLPGYYAQATACLVPSRFEAFPYTCLEAMACGRPVLVAQAGGLAEIITPGADGLMVPADDAISLGDAAVAVLTDQALARRLGDAARATVLERYTTATVARRTAAVYRRAAMLGPA